SRRSEMARMPPGAATATKTAAAATTAARSSVRSFMARCSGPPVPARMARARDLAADRLTMYTYIMQRTPIYLTDEETAALDRLTETPGRTKSDLLRAAMRA